MYKLLTLMIGLFILIGCGKEEECDDCLETFRCKINGEKWEPSCSDAAPVGWCEDIDCQYYIDDGGLIFRVENDNQMDRFLFSTYAPVTGIYNVLGGSRAYINFNKGNCGGYDLIQELPNYIELTALDTINYTVEGNFAFSVLGTCNSDTIHITDGYFHLAYRF